MKYKLMIVDDERRIRQGIACSCNWEELGIAEVIQAENGLDAYQKLKEDPVNIILSDIVMPEIDGLMLAEIVRREFPDILVYLLTGYSEFEYARRALQNGVRNYILKPSEDEEICAVMKDAVSELRRRDLSKQRAIDLEREIVGELSGEKADLLSGYISDTISGRDFSIPRPQSSHPVILKILRYVEEHISDESLNLATISADFLFLNADYVGKLFKKEMKTKFSSYLLETRIRFAIQYIHEHPGAKVYEIAQASGFGNNSSYFSVVFKKLTGRNPTEYK